MGDSKAIVGLVLCGGKSSRMCGHNKALLDYKGNTMLQTMINKLSFLEEIYLSVNDKAQYPWVTQNIILDQYGQIGPMGGICSALELCNADAVFVVPCDMPKLTNTILKKLKQSYEENRKCTILKHESRVQPLVGVYTIDIIPCLREMIAKNQYRMTSLLERIDLQILEVEEDVCSNINTEEAYKRLVGGNEL